MLVVLNFTLNQTPVNSQGEHNSAKPLFTHTYTTTMTLISTPLISVLLHILHISSCTDTEHWHRKYRVGCLFVQYTNTNVPMSCFWTSEKKGVTNKKNF